MYRKLEFLTRYNYGNRIVDLGEYVLSFANSCNLGCSYCYLRYVKTPNFPLVYKNIEGLENELEEILSKEDEKIYINCGETTDSLLTDSHLEVIKCIIDIISKLADKYNKKVFMELRTKTLNLYNLKLENKSKNFKIVYAVSLMPEEIMSKFEKKNIDIEKRLQTLLEAYHRGWLLGFRFEPIIIWPVLGISYEDVLQTIKNLISEYQKLFYLCKPIIVKCYDSIHSVSFSILRLVKNQYKLLKEEKSEMLFPEMFLCLDGKYRYSRPIRIEIYRNLIDTAKNIFSSTILDKIFLATEFDYVWQSCGVKPKNMIDLTN